MVNNIKSMTKKEKTIASIIISIAIIILIILTIIGNSNPFPLEKELIFNDYEILSEFNGTLYGTTLPLYLIKVNLTLRLIETEGIFKIKNENTHMSYYFFRIDFEGNGLDDLHFPLYEGYTFKKYGVDEKNYQYLLENISTVYYDERFGYMISDIDWITENDIKGEYRYRNYYTDEAQDITGDLFFIVPKDVKEFIIIYADGNHLSVKFTIEKE